MRLFYSGFSIENCSDRQYDGTNIVYIHIPQRRYVNNSLAGESHFQWFFNFNNINVFLDCAVQWTRFRLLHPHTKLAFHHYYYLVLFFFYRSFHLFDVDNELMSNQQTIWNSRLISKLHQRSQNVLLGAAVHSVRFFGCDGYLSLR